MLLTMIKRTRRTHPNDYHLSKRQYDLRSFLDAEIENRIRVNSNSIILLLDGQSLRRLINKRILVLDDTGFMSYHPERYSIPQWEKRKLLRQTHITA